MQIYMYKFRVPSRACHNYPQRMCGLGTYLMQKRKNYAQEESDRFCAIANAFKYSTRVVRVNYYVCSRNRATKNLIFFFIFFTDVGETINGTVGHVKEAVVGAVQGIGHGLDGAMHNANNEVKKVEAAVTNLGNNGITNTMKTNSDPSDTNTTEFTYIPLKDPNSSNVDEHLEEFKENLLKKAQSFSDDTDKMADDLIKETEDVVREAAKETTAMAQSIPDKLVKEVTDIDDKTPTHSLDSLKTNSPEPEIEKALANDMHKSAPSPEPTLAELSAIKADEQQ